MDFLNSYTSIFKQEMKRKLFLQIFLLIILIIFIVSLVLNRLDFTLNTNDVIRKYQLSKINNNDFSDVSTIIIGDSSGGNAIDSVYFTKISSLQTKNLCLTGSWGLIGSLGILKNAYAKNKKIKNVLIIQTLDIWGRSYPKEAVLELFTVNDAINYLNVTSLLGYLLNPKEIIWNIKHLLTYKKIPPIDMKHDYTLQKEKKYSSNTKEMKVDTNLNNIQILNDKLLELKQLEQFCIDKNLNCILLNGPIHSTIAKNSLPYIQKMNQHLQKYIEIQYQNKIFQYPNKYIGDSADHIDIKYKRKVTEDYYNAIKKSLFRNPYN